MNPNAAVGSRVTPTALLVQAGAGELCCPEGSAIPELHGFFWKCYGVHSSSTEHSLSRHLVEPAAKLLLVRFVLG